MNLYPYQVEGRDWLKGRTHGILADEQGLGKTAQAAQILIPGSIVVCPSHLCLNWEHELKVWRPELKTQVLRKRVDRLADDTDVAIVGYPNLQFVDLPPCRVLVADESHYCKDRSAQRTKAVGEYAVHADSVFLLTGTPIPNRPRELWTQLRMVRGTQLSYQAFTEAFAAGRVERVRVNGGTREFWDDSGASNLDELRAVVGKVALRRLKANVLTELPAKTHQVIPLDVPVSKRETAILKSLTGAIATQPLNPASVAFAEISAARHDLGNAKVKACIEHITSFLDDNEDQKVIVFGWHVDVMDALQAALTDYGVVRVDGSTSQVKRQEAVDYFQHQNLHRVFLGNIVAAGTGITLTAAQTVMFVELDWVPGNLAQAADRAHRIGQRGNVQIQYLVANDGLEHRLLESQWQKIVTIEEVLADA